MDAGLCGHALLGGATTICLLAVAVPSATKNECVYDHAKEYRKRCDRTKKVDREAKLAVAFCEKRGYEAGDENHVRDNQQNAVSGASVRTTFVKGKNPKQ
jgi:hypothetical protein